MIEESLYKSTQWAVLEPNDANTSTKVRAMTANYLTDKWRDGALAGSKPEHALFVNCGLGNTMTQQDIIEGRLIVQLGLAVVRPAEFIVLRFDLKVPTS
jgi:phage tail sheath protein FI